MSAIPRCLPCLLLVLALSRAWPLNDLMDDVDDTVSIVANPGDADGDTDRVWREYFDDVNSLLRSAVGEPSQAAGRMVANWEESSGENAEEQGDYMEGDILAPPALFRNGLTAQAARWPGGIVPYQIDSSFGPRDLNMIESAFNAYHSKTCVRFQRHNGERDYIRITRANTGCWSSVGRIGGMQEVNLQSPGCLTKVGTPIHELMHAVGFMHEQNRSERDNYVDILWHNIESGRNNNFDKAADGSVSGHGVGYDYGSVMHYSPNSFSKNNQPTIVSKKQGRTMGQREGFSAGDVAKINNMYKCGRNNDQGNRPAKQPSLFQSLFGG